MTIRATPTIDLLPVRLDGRSVVHVRAEHAGERDEWEIHPDQDEFLYLVQGATDVVLRDDLDDGSRERVIELQLAGFLFPVPGTRTGNDRRNVSVRP
jgi:hypothetical protein